MNVRLESVDFFAILKIKRTYCSSVCPTTSDRADHARFPPTVDVITVDGKLYLISRIRQVDDSRQIRKTMREHRWNLTVF